MSTWKDTLNLPRTGFPMKANLRAAEPRAMARWEEFGLYERIRARRAGAPRFVLRAVKDPDGANLDRVQIVKVWRDGDDYRDQVYDVALSDGRVADPATGAVPALGNTVDVANATYANTIGATQLAAVWEDPAFYPGVPAVYYLRAIEIPTPRWSLFVALKFGWPHPSDRPLTLQERAWSSAIWYVPAEAQ